MRSASGFSFEKLGGRRKNRVIDMYCSTATNHNRARSIATLYRSSVRTPPPSLPLYSGG
jgi:hypothetical protein